MICEVCLCEKDIMEFRKNGNWVGKKCKSCRREVKKIWDQNNKAHTHEYQKQYIKVNAKYISVRRKKYNEENKEAKRVYEMNRYYGSEQFRIAHNARNRINQIIRIGKGERSHKVSLVGCSRKELVEHLTKRFKDGMTWDNYGTVWEIDHIIPLSLFDLKNNEQLQKACFYKNLQPLFTIENKIKSNKILK